MNNWTGCGRLVKDAELKKTPSGTAVCTFTIAVNKDEKVKEGEKDAWFFDCVAWGKKAEYISSYGKKGDAVAVTGAIRFKEYEGKNGHVNTIEVIADRLNIVAKNNREPKPDVYKEAGFTEKPDPKYNEDLPF